MSDGGAKASAGSFDGSKLTDVELNFMRSVEQRNIERVQRLTKIRRNNRILGSVLGLGVVSIYLYSMHSIKQETFLDDFNPPEKVAKQ